MKVADLKRLFVHEKDRFTNQIRDEVTGKITYISVNEPINDDYLKKHIDGLLVVGVYPVRAKDKTCKWFCIDIDIKSDVHKSPEFKIEDYKDRLKELAFTVKSKLQLSSINGYIEDTGGKGMHVWVFFSEPIPAAKAVQALVPIFSEIKYDKNIFDIEYFPTSETSKSVKLPAGINKRYNMHSSMEVPADMMELTPSKNIYDLTNPLEAVYTKCEAFRRLKEKAETERKLNHKERMAIATMGAGKTQADLEFIGTYYYEHCENFDPNITEKQILNISSTLKPITCDKMIEHGICLGKCDAIGSHKSPIAFYYEETREAQQHGAGDAAFVKPQDNLLMKNNSFWRTTRNGEWIQVSNFILDIVQQEYIEDGDKEQTLGTLICKITTDTEEVFDFKIPIDDYEDNAVLGKRLKDVMGMGRGIYVNPNEMTNLKLCIEKFSKPTSLLKTRNFGFDKEFEFYYTPTVLISKNGITPNDKKVVEITSQSQEKEKKLDLALPEEERSEEFWRKYLTDDVMSIYAPHLFISIMSHLFGAFLKHKFGSVDNENPYILWFAGKSGTGKSKMCMIAQRFFGKFSQLYTFNSTANRIQHSGSFYKDALFIVDDFKQNYFSKKESMDMLMGILQAYADNAGRGRMNRSGSSGQDIKSMRGQLIINGEDFVTQEVSVVGRCIVIPVADDAIKKDNYDKFKYIQDTSLFISEFTPYLIQWCMNVNPEDVIDTQSYYLRELMEVGSDHNENKSRIITNMSKFMTYARFAIDYLYMDDPDLKFRRQLEFDKFAYKAFADMLDITGAESLGRKVWEALTEMISMNRVCILAKNQRPDDIRTVPIGFVENGEAFININQLYDQAKKHMANISQISHNYYAVKKALIDDGFIDEQQERKAWNGSKPYFHKMLPDKYLELQGKNASTEGK